MTEFNLMNYVTGRYPETVLAAVLLALSFPPYHLFFLAPLAFALLARHLPGTERWTLVRTTATFGFVFYLLHVYWFVSFHAMAFPGVLIVLTVYFAVWGYLLSWVGVNAWTVAGGWILTQLITGGGFLAFPWSRLATAFAVHPVLVQPVRWTGELVFGGLVVFVGYSFGQCLRDRTPYRRFLLSAGLLVVLLGGGLYRLRTTDVAPYEQDVLLVQPNVMSTFGAANQSDSQLSVLRKQTQRHARRGDVVVWPETALLNFPLEFGSTGQNLTYRDFRHRRRLESYVDEGIYLLAGIRFYDPHPNKLAYLNGAVLLNPKGEPVDYYTKRIMVPFGEYIPGMGQYEWIESFGRAVGTLGYRPGRRGGLIELPFGENVVTAAVQICYEDVFPGYVHEQVRRGADLLVNISNDSWSRSTAAHWQHFYRARLRAIETGRSLLRNGNTGVSALIGPLGRVGSRLDPFEKGVLRVRPLKPLKKSYIVKWNSWITLGVMILALGVGTWKSYRLDKT